MKVKGVYFQIQKETLVVYLIAKRLHNCSYEIPFATVTDHVL